MPFDEIDKADLVIIREQLAQLALDRGLSIGDLTVNSNLESEALETQAVLLNDLLLASSGNASHRQIRMAVTTFW